MEPDQRSDASYTAFNTSEPTNPGAASSPAGEQSFVAPAPQQPAYPPFTGYTPYPSYTAEPYQPYQPYQPAPYHAPAPVATSARSRATRYALLGAALLALLLVAFGVGARVNAGSGSGASSRGVVTTTSSPAVSVPPSAQDLQQTVINVVKTDQPSIVEVTSDGSGQEAIGSGEILTKDGYIVTNDHVVAGFNSYSVTYSNGKTDTATVVGQDAQDDLAVLKVNESNLTPIAVADSSQTQVGEFAIAIGSPLGLDQSATFGIVSALNRTEAESTGGSSFAQQSSGNILPGLVQTSAPINPGNSGGALVNLQGQLIGIPTLGATSDSSGQSVSGIGFAIPSNRVTYVANQLIQNGKLTHSNQGFLGIQGQDVTARLAQQNGLSTSSGVLVGGFAQDASGKSAAQAAGIQTGDVIVSVDGQPVASSSDLASATLSRTPGTQVSVGVARNGKTITVRVTLGERPVSS